MKPKVLIIDDEEPIRSSLRMIFEYEGYECLLAANGAAGLQLAKRESPDIIFLDIKMPQMDGMEVLRQLNPGQESAPVVILSGHGTVKTAVEATKLGAFDFIEKPPESERILLVARNALSQKRLTDENQRLRLSFDDRFRMVGQSAAIERVWEAIRRAAPTSATVLITGESGVGKEMVARAIHRNSLRKDEAFVQVNCAAIPEELIESELFGHEKGSFTGATEKQIGKFELAHKGTIFLDEIGDMSLRTQAKVLRVLQEGEVERIGSQKTIQVDVRVIAATNKKVEQIIENGEFREDLYFRLSVIPVEVPPLRERPGDIPLLVESFINQFCRENNYRRRSLTPGALAALKKQPWRGNVRELRNTIERLLIMVSGEEITEEDLSQVNRRSPQNAFALENTSSLKDFKEAAERAFIVQKLKETRWNISATAAVIGTPRSNLYKKLDQYGITQEKDG
ncbi:MAG: sigma-54-dependent Fis family transcriptional regulator [Vicinamibacteria bacterium]|nr:sigma-54-dependent Fis family transcriptional regulator [Vicinamibacteria bacterium]